MPDEAPGGAERRFGKRLKLPVTVHVRVEDGPVLSAKVHDVNARGLSLESLIGAQVGDRVAVDFEGYPGVCEAFSLTGQVVRILDEVQNGVGVEVNRKANPPEAVNSYRTLVLHYLHHRPLLDDVGKGYFEGRCTKCGWVGRVGARAPKCSRCGGTVEPIRA
jgi:PilZ domain